MSATAYCSSESTRETSGSNELCWCNYHSREEYVSALLTVQKYGGPTPKDCFPCNAFPQVLLLPLAIAACVISLRMAWHSDKHTKLGKKYTVGCNNYDC